MSAAELQSAVAEVRAFNRFYTREVGLLHERHVGSALSLPEVRVLYELAHGGSASPTALARTLALDGGYVSRLVRSLERRRLVSLAPSGEDGRRKTLQLTASGRRSIERLESATRERLGALLDPLAPAARDELVASMAAIRRVLGYESPAAIVLRDPRPGDIGTVIARQATLYADEYGWDRTYEGLIAGICAKFVERFNPALERCWIADRGGAVVGSVFVVRRSATVAQLRLLYVDPSARGRGLGRQLVDACVAFARAAGYRRMTLWTNDVLVSARRIYAAAGFVLVHEEKHRSFGADLVGQNWELGLR